MVEDKEKIEKSVREEIGKNSIKKEKEEKPELEREYIIPTRKKILKVPRYKRAKRAIKTIKEFLAKHMHVEGRDSRKVKIDRHLNEEIWFRGIKNPLTKIRVKAKKIKGIVYAELAEIPAIIQYKINKEKKFRERIVALDVKKSKLFAQKKEESDVEKGKIEEKEKENLISVEQSTEKKSEARSKKHENSGVHKERTQPRRQALKR